MDFGRIIDLLEQNGVNDCEEIISEDNYSIIRFCYDFDKEEIDAARAYANEESGLKEDSTEWYENYYLSYLYDIAKDNLQEIMEEICEEFELEGEFKELNETESSEYMKGFFIFCEDSSDIDIDEILSRYI